MEGNKEFFSPGNSETNQVDSMKKSSRGHKKVSIKDIPESILINTIKTSISYKEIFRKLNLADSNTNRDVIKKLIKERQISVDHFYNTPETKRKVYYKNPKYCKECGKIIPFEKAATNTFCSPSCATKYSNRQRIKMVNKTMEENLTNDSVPKNNEHKHREYKKFTEKEKDRIYIKKHNRIIEKKYSSLGIPKVNDGCCFICGEYHCKNEFCKKHNFQQLIGLVKYVGFDPKVIGTKEVFAEFKRVKNYVYDLYWLQEISTIGLEKIFNCNNRQVINIFRYLEIPHRTLSEGVKNYIKNNGAYQVGGKVLEHVTWFGEKIFLRSKYELDFANELDNNQVNYQVESLRLEYFDTVRNTNRIAIPDFYLPDTKELIEIKSDYTLDIQEMIDRFNSYINLGYVPKLILEHKEVDIFNIEGEIGIERIKKINETNIRKRHDK